MVTGLEAISEHWKKVKQMKDKDEKKGQVYGINKHGRTGWLIHPDKSSQI